MRRAEAKEANRRALLDAASALVGREGAGVRLEAVARAAGLTTGAIYSIFGSKADLLAAVLAEEISRADPAARQGFDPSLPLEAVIDRYVLAWIAAAADYPKAKAAFELHLLLAAMDDDELRRRLAGMLDAEVRGLARLLEDRVVDPARPSRRTTPEQGLAIAKAMKAVLTGFGLREPFTAGAGELARQACLALTALARAQPGGPGGG